MSRHSITSKDSKQSRCSTKTGNNAKEKLYAWYPCTMNPYSVPSYKNFSTLADVRELESQVLPPPMPYRTTSMQQRINSASVMSKPNQRAKNGLRSSHSLLPRRPATTGSTMLGTCRTLDRQIIADYSAMDCNRNLSHPIDQMSGHVLKKEIVGDQGIVHPLVRHLDRSKSSMSAQTSIRRKPIDRPVFSSIPQGLRYHCPEAEIHFTPAQSEASSVHGALTGSGNADIGRHTRPPSRAVSAASIGSTILQKRDISTSATLDNLIRRATDTRPDSQIDVAADLTSRPKTATTPFVRPMTGLSMRESEISRPKTAATENLDLRTSSANVSADKLKENNVARDNDTKTPAIDDAESTFDINADTSQSHLESIQELTNELTARLTDEEVLEKTEATQTEAEMSEDWIPEIFDDYEEARMHYGWEMEMQGDPYNIKNHYLPKRLPITVKLPEPDVLPLEPVLRKVDKDVFFHHTAPRHVFSFVLHPKFKSERFNVRRQEMIRNGEWQYSFKNFSFTY